MTEAIPPIIGLLPARAHKVYRELQKGNVLPGHKYIGPGNPLQNGRNRSLQKVDADGRIAQQHDERYTNAKSSNDVSIADQEFLNDWADDGNIRSLIGAIGIGAKHSVEKVTGTFIHQKVRKIRKSKFRVSDLRPPWEQDPVAWSAWTPWTRGMKLGQ
ncbi:unnamed protein product [Allacma fusca]|uniref:Phospholipase A2-like domain-containing protein n=1 Tax=Allacma fusca TaxID=39272 RepID=A0A8J2P3A1_9HEXA|nr:unnamed protein product [Allacma fusca]